MVVRLKFIEVKVERRETNAVYDNMSMSRRSGYESSLQGDQADF